MIGDALLFLVKHLDVVELLYDAIANQNIDKRRLVNAIKAEMVRAADEEMKEELG